MDNTPKARLPPEVIMSIVESLIPETTSHSRPIFPASHLVTKTLLDLRLVSKAVYSIASRLLWQNCLRIESTKTLHLFCDFISRESVTGRMPCEAYGSTRLFLAPFNSPSFCLRWGNPTDGEAREEAINPSVDKYPPWFHALKDEKTAEAVKKVLITLAPVLKAIIVDLPLKSLYHENYHPVQNLLREGFEALVNVEELVSIYGELSWDIAWDRSEPEIWTKWPKLQRLALHNVQNGPQLWKNMILCPELEMVVLPHADFRDSQMEPTDVSAVNIKDDWSRAWTEATSQQTMSFEDRIPYQGREVLIAFCESLTGLPSFDAFTDSWERLDPDNRICITAMPPYQQHHPDYEHNLMILRSTWMKDRALRGLLWDDVYRYAVVNLEE
ncbi:hypothetical protein FPSE_07313 [Fusarium pseudograminearum CS3096]|uniref:F-box domain-containing protein n=1 Tax=Fusarium pseudograminearum (strain CS3096) TaxID=1028729 RepID=K3VE69_FUSPC|nr:hypothetical protein FPSE_07313 [Fusarium pseudograminearum CS3096]EKJ72432.1 hypothetical protein FPSE_07313 [Fusarium pseudograminearum CS3096]KAF0637669.1 hypothetical protein FPSE5266_07313 [Fusarium pseudograminearum]